MTREAMPARHAASDGRPDVRAISWIGAFIQIAPLAAVTGLLFLALIDGPGWPFYLVVAALLVASFVSLRLAMLAGLLAFGALAWGIGILVGSEHVYSQPFGWLLVASASISLVGWLIRRLTAQRSTSPAPR
jgi:hypothetical protein